MPLRIREKSRRNPEKPEEIRAFRFCAAGLTSPGKPARIPLKHEAGGKTMNDVIESIILNPEELLVGQISYEELLSELRI